jgi:hypothetical protein
MNEGLLVKLVMGTTPVRINARQTDGLIVDGESDIWPRRMRVTIVPRSDTAAYRMRRVRQINSWPYPEYKLRCEVKNGGLLFTGVTPDGLPGGDYWFSLEVEDLPSVADRYKVFLRDDAETSVSVQVAADSRRIILSDKIRDPEIQRVIAASTVGDDWKVSDWLQDPRPRITRKACLFNLLAKLRTAPNGDEPLIKYVDRLIFVGTERVYAKVTPGFFEDLSALARDPEKPFYNEGSPKAAIHYRLLSAAKVSEDDYELVSFRQEKHPSMQVVVAAPKNRHGDYFADLDIDLGNPLQDIQGLVIHMTELLNTAPTDQIALFPTLARDQVISPFLYYSISDAGMTSTGGSASA